MPDDNTPSNTQAVALRPTKVYTPVEAAVGMMDTARFEHLGRVANVLAMANLLPKSLTHTGQKLDEPLPFPVVQARAYAIVGQAELWNADPLAVAQCTSLVYGKLCYEGKLIHGLIEARAGVRLRYEFGRYDAKKRDIVPADDLKADDRSFGVRVSARFPDEDFDRWIAGSVEMWHTGDKGPWQNPLNWPRQCRYRGAREWARAHQPHLVLGILTDDEVDDFNALALTRAEERATRGQKQDLRGKLKGPQESDEGFSANHIENETRGRVIDAEATVVETELKVGGEPEREEADAGNGAQSAAQASATSDSATDASGASPDQTDPGQTESSSKPDAGSEETLKEDRPAEKPKRTRTSSAKAAAPAPAPAPDPIGDFIDSLAGMSGWATEIKPAWFAFKKSDEFKSQPKERQVDASVALTERLFELNESAGDGALLPHMDPTFFVAWCTYTREHGVRPTCAKDVAKELSMLRQTEAFQRLTEGARQQIEGYAAEVIGETGAGII